MLVALLWYHFVCVLQLYQKVFVLQRKYWTEKIIGIQDTHVSSQQIRRKHKSILKGCWFFCVFCNSAFSKMTSISCVTKNCRERICKRKQNCVSEHFTPYWLPSNDICLVGPFSPKHCQGRNFSISCSHFWQVWNDIPEASILKVSFSAFPPCIKSSFL